MRSLARSHVRIYRCADIQPFILAINCKDICRDDYIGNYIGI